MIYSAINHFLWHANPFSNKLIHILFNKIAQPCEKGGLGIINLSTWNKAVTSKHINKLLLGKNGLLQNWLRVKYIEQSNFWTLTPQPDSRWY